MPAPSGEASNMRHDLAYAPDAVRMDIVKNIVVDLETSKDDAARFVGQRAKELLKDGKEFETSQLIVRYLRGENTGGRRKTRKPRRKSRKTRKTSRR